MPKTGGSSSMENKRLDKEELKDFARTLLDQGKANLTEDGGVQPILFILLDHGTMISPLDFSSDIHKEITAKIIEMAAEKLKPYAIFMICEAWMITREGDYYFDKAPSECDDKTEIVQVSGSNGNGLTVEARFSFFRDDNDNPVPSDAIKSEVFEINDPKNQQFNRFIPDLW